jgi:hypothetical protein
MLPDLRIMLLYKNVYLAAGKMPLQIGMLPVGRGRRRGFAIRMWLRDAIEGR